VGRRCVLGQCAPSPVVRKLVAIRDRVCHRRKVSGSFRVYSMDMIRGLFDTEIVATATAALAALH
jgi:hypothetical protein